MIDIDRVVYILRDVHLPHAESRLKLLHEVFPFVEAGQDTFNDYRVTTTFLELFGYSRGLGLALEDCAYSCDMTYTLLKDLFIGKGLSVEKYLDLCDTELCARAYKKKELLNRVDIASANSADVALRLLEKSYPKEFGTRATLEHLVDESLSEALEKVIADDMTSIEAAQLYAQMIKDT